MSYCSSCSRSSYSCYSICKQTFLTNASSCSWSCLSIFHGLVFRTCYDRTVSGEENGGEMRSLEDNEHKRYHAHTYRSFCVVGKVQTVPAAWMCIIVVSLGVVGGRLVVVSGKVHEHDRETSSDVKKRDFKAKITRTYQR